MDRARYTEFMTLPPKADNGTTKPAPKRTIGKLAAALPRIDEIIETASLICPCGCGVMQKIGEDRSVRLDTVPAQLSVIVTGRPKYARRTCTYWLTHLQGLDFRASPFIFSPIRQMPALNT